jgi:hypothetical protein
MRQCIVEACGVKAQARNMCKKHYAAWYRKENPDHQNLYMHPCRVCNRYSIALDYCRLCRKTLTTIKSFGWKAQVLEISTYYRTTRAGSVLRVYVKNGAKWEVEREGKTALGTATSLSVAMQKAINLASSKRWTNDQLS